MLNLKNVLLRGAKNTRLDKGEPRVLIKSNLFTTGKNGEVVLIHDGTIEWVEKILINMSSGDSQEYLNLLYKEYEENPSLYDLLSKKEDNHCEKLLPLRAYYNYCRKHGVPIQTVFPIIQLSNCNLGFLPYINIITLKVKTSLMYSKRSEWYHHFISIVPIAQLGDVYSLSNTHLTYLVKTAYEAWWEYIISDSDTLPNGYISPEELDFKELETALNEGRKEW